MKKIKLLLSAAALASVTTLSTTPAQAANDPFIGEIMMVGYSFCPRGWANADGQLLPISSNSALFSLYGTTFGGDGRTTFSLPDFRGRSAAGQGSGPGLSTLQMGQKGGSDSLTMTVAQMPKHTHRGGIQTTTVNATTPNAKGGSFSNAAGNTYSTGTPSKNFMHQGTMLIQNTGDGQAIFKRSPFLTIRYCVALVGIYPSRN